MNITRAGLDVHISYPNILGLRTRVIRAGSGRPLFFLHGWGCSAETMLSLGKGLHHTRCCYFFDFPGFGESDTPGEVWDISRYASFTHELICSLSGQQPADVVAHSFGGRVMLNLLADPSTSGSFGKVIITGGAGMKPKRSFSYYWKTSLAKILKAPAKLLPEHRRESYQKRIRKTRLWKTLGSSEYAQLSGVMRQIFVKTVREYQNSLLPEIAKEVLLVWGENDDATPLYQAKQMEKGLQNGVLITLKDAGHYAFLDRPVQFKAILASYFSDSETS